MLANIDTNNQINTEYYKNATIDIIQRCISDSGNDPNKITANQLRAYFRQAYYTLFKPDKPTIANNQNNIPYTSSNIEKLFNIYIDVCEMFSCIPSVYGFTRYTGIEEPTLYKYVTAARLQMLKSRKDYLQNMLSNTPIGGIALANNDQDSGLMYNRQNILDKQTIQQNISVSDFVKIAQNDAET